MEEKKRIAYIAIISFGLVSLFGDIIYEGARGAISPYFEFLGATAFIFGVIISIGDFLGYTLRLISGYIADIKKTYWIFILLGYGLLIAIPLLAFVRYLPIIGPAWLLAGILVIIERIAKALRSPARDTLLSITTRGVGVGKAFGLHELMDQIGAIAGPALVALVLFLTGNDFFYAFLILFIPYILLLVVLSQAYIRLRTYTNLAFKSIQEEKKELGKAELPREFNLYTLAVFMNTAGLIHILLILYVASRYLGMQAWLIAVLYIIVQGIDAIIAPFSGYMYDKFGRKVLGIPFILAILPTFFVLLKTASAIFLASIFFGIILGMQESIYRAAVADIVPLERRGTGYGIFNTIYGIGFLVSGSLFGFFIDYNLLNIAVIYTTFMQIIALIFLISSLEK